MPDKNEDKNVWNMTETEKRDVLEAARKNRAAAETESSDARADAVENLEFMLGGQYQWPTDIWNKRTDAGLPCLTINDIPKYVNQIIGGQLKNRPQIKVKPENSAADPEMCQHLADHIRHIEHTSQADAIRDEAYKHMCCAGYPAHWLVVTEYCDGVTFDQRIMIRPIKNQFSVFRDPNAQMPDGRDAMWCLINETVSHEDFKARWPKFANKIPASADAAGIGEGFEKWYLDNKLVVSSNYVRRQTGEMEVCLLSTGHTVERTDADRLVSESNKLIKKAGRFLGISAPQVEIVRTRKEPVFSCYHMVITGSEIIEEPQRIPGRRGLIPVVTLFPPKLIVEGKEYPRSIIQDAKDPKRLYNYWVSITTERIVPKPDYIVTEPMISGHEEHWESAKSKRLPYLVVNDTPAGMPKETMPHQMSTAEVDMRRQAIDDVKATLGIYDLNVGNAPAETSGVAIRARDAQMDTGTYEYYNSLLRANKLTGDVILDMIPEVHDTERNLPTIGFDGTEKVWHVNRKRKESWLKGGGIVIENDLSTGVYGAIIDNGPNYATLQEESRDVLINFAAKVDPRNPVAPLIAQALNIQNGEKLVEVLKALQPAEIQKLYDDQPEGEEQAQIPPEAQAAIDQMKQKLEQAAQMMQQMQQEIAALKQEEAVKVAKVQSDEKLGMLKIEQERQRIEQEIAVKIRAIEAESRVKMEKIGQEIRLQERKMTAEMVRQERDATRGDESRREPTRTDEGRREATTAEAKAPVVVVGNGEIAQEIATSNDKLVQQVAQSNEQVIQELRAGRERPEPGRKTIRIIRDSEGRISGAEVTEQGGAEE